MTPAITALAATAFAMATTALRIVSVSPATTEDLFAIGAGANVVAIDEFSKRPRAAMTLPRVGGIYDVNVEDVLGRRPSLVVFQQPDTPQTAGLAATGARVLAIPYNSLADDWTGIRELGRATGHTTEAERLVRSLQARMQRSSRRVAHERRLRVLVVEWANPIDSLGKGAFPDDLLKLANLENVLHDSPQPWFAVSPEIVALTKPDVIVVADGDGSTVAIPPDGVPWEMLGAARGKRIVHLREALDCGPYIADLLDDLIRSVAPYR